jgi:enterochelin esterase-like enzyme
MPTRLPRPVRRPAPAVVALAALAAGAGAAAAQPATPAARRPPPPRREPAPRRHRDRALPRNVPSRHVAPRHVEVWLPPGYDRAPGARYPVLYMHDGQNVFAPATSYTQVDWASTRR